MTSYRFLKILKIAAMELKIHPGFDFSDSTRMQLVMTAAKIAAMMSAMQPAVHGRYWC